MIPASLTAEQCLLTRADLPDAGQWSELIRGVTVALQPPDLEHGNTVLNFSKLLSAYVHAGHQPEGYPCFDVGLIVERRPDTVFFPAISYFMGGQRFAEADREITETVPRLVIELMSTNDRRVGMHDKTNAYFGMGVPSVWHVDPVQRVVHLNFATQPARRVSEFETLRDELLLPGFAVKVAELFVEPKWVK